MALSWRIRYRMPVMLLADGTLGQMMEPVSLNYGEPVTVEKPWATNGTRMQRKHNICNSLFFAARGAGARKHPPLPAL